MDTADALSSAAAGMRLQADRLDVIAQNLANASTTGYRERTWSVGRFADGVASVVATSERQGSLRRTGVATDLALVGRGYLTVQSSAGVRYTRDGALRPTPDGSLADSRGSKVLGALGPVRFPRGAHIEPDGRVMADGRVVDRLRVVQFAGASLAEDGAYLYAPAGAVPSRAEATVHTGYLEDSGVDPVTEMSSLVTAERAYEADAKAAQQADESLRRAVTDVPAVHS